VAGAAQQQRTVHAAEREAEKVRRAEQAELDGRERVHVATYRHQRSLQPVAHEKQRYAEEQRRHGRQSSGQETLGGV
jgi:hypothetical protein